MRSNDNFCLGMTNQMILFELELVMDIGTKEVLQLLLSVIKVSQLCHCLMYAMVVRMFHSYNLL